MDYAPPHAERPAAARPVVRLVVETTFGDGAHCWLSRV